MNIINMKKIYCSGPSCYNELWVPARDTGPWYCSTDCKTEDDTPISSIATDGREITDDFNQDTDGNGPHVSIDRETKLLGQIVVNLGLPGV